MIFGRNKTTSVIDTIREPFQRFFKIESSAGILLIFFTILALFLANSPWGNFYQDLLATKISFTFGEFDLGKPLILWINDGLMAIFFFMVGLEIKREIITGELSSFQKSALPIGAAIGGMLLPAVIFSLLNQGKPGSEGWGIPMATDIAFSLGILSLLGRRVPLSLKVFLAAFAIVDDLGAIMVIALFYSADIEVNLLLIAGGLFLILILLNYLNVSAIGFYMVIGWLIWYLFLKAGIHPTLAGVLIAFTIPLRRKIRVPVFVDIMNKNLDEFCVDDCDDDVTLNSQQINALDSIDDLTDQVKSPLQSLEHQLQGLVMFVIMPLFAFVNAGVMLTGGMEHIFGSLSLNIALALFLGKVAGVFLFSWIFVRVGIARLPSQVKWVHIIGLGFLGGIGFTMSLFISNLAFPGSDILSQAKIGILIGSLVSGIAGYVILNMSLKKNP